MDRISTDTEFNTQKLLQGGFTDKTIHIGANADQNLKVNIASMGAGDLSVNGTTSFSDQELVTAGGGSVTINGTYSGEKVISEISFAVTIDATPENSKVGVTVKFADGSADLTGTLAMGNLSMTIPDGLTISLTAPNALTDETTIATLTDILPSKMVGIDVSSQDAANSAITTVNNAINTVSGERSKLGAIQNRLEHTIANLATSSENLTAAESRIRDVDIAVEMMNFTKYQILAQASTAMLAQANAKPQAVLQLLR
jgi:flagellin